MRIQLVIDEDVMAKIDEIAGERHRRAIVVDQALREFIEREDAKPKKRVKIDPKTKLKTAPIKL